METTITKTCECGQTFETEACPDWPFLEGKECMACEEKSRIEHEKKMAEDSAAKAAEQRTFFEGEALSMTPKRIAMTDVEHPQFNRQLWAKVASWKPTEERPWLGLIGDPGESKTRCAYLLLRKFAAEQADAGRKRFGAAVISGMDFNRLAVERYSKERINHGGLGGSVSIAESAAGILREARTASVLIFDELAKVRSAPGTIDELFALIDFRHAANLTTVWTSNSEPEHFCAAWPHEFGGPAAGRILESSTIIRA